MPTATDLDLEQVARLRLAVARVSRRLRTVPAGQGMTSTQLSVLAAVVRAGPVKLADLATAEDVNPTMLSRIVAKLDGDGLLTRSSDPDDARVVVVHATTAGRRRHDRIRQQRTEALAAVLVDLDPDHVRALSAAVPALEELGAALRERRA
ncbi:MAG: MarR family winged helix-turn-helix transcriptional regulator [Mycobacteriales bacterium]